MIRHHYHYHHHRNHNCKQNYWGLKAVILLMFVLSKPVQAEGSLYEIQYLLLDTNFETANYEPSALLYKHIIPYNSFINLEGIVALGITEESETRKTGIAGIYKQKLKLSNMLGIMANIWGEVEPRVHAYLHFGLVRIDYDISTPGWVGGPDGSQNDTGLAYGVGMTFHILEKGAFVLEYNEFPDVDIRNDVIDTSVLSIGYQMPF